MINCKIKFTKIYDFYIQNQCIFFYYVLLQFCDRCRAISGSLKLNLCRDLHARYQKVNPTRIQIDWDTKRRIYRAEDRFEAVDWNCCRYIPKIPRLAEKILKNSAVAGVEVDPCHAGIFEDSTCTSREAAYTTSRVRMDSCWPKSPHHCVP